MNTSFDPLLQQYSSQRFPIYARGGMVNSANPQASAAGLNVLLKGGNAMDAAVATASALTVVDPSVNGIGSDAFAIIWSEKDQKLYGLNSSGCAPMLASHERILEEGKDNEGKMPSFGWIPVNVPGAPAAWAAINEKFGNLSLLEDLTPAIDYADKGYVCAPNLGAAWKGSAKRYEALKEEDPAFLPWFDTFCPEGRPYEAGDMIRLPDHARTLRIIGESNANEFYRGSLARKIDEESRKYGGYLRYEDLEAHEVQWVDPVRLNYRGYEVCEIPPNGQGIIALMALNILKNFTFTHRDNTDTFHKQIEAIKMAFADGLHYITDPRFMEIDYHELLSPEYGAKRAAQMKDTAEIWTYDVPHGSGTVYFCCADGEGNMVSYIQSNYMGFGSGIVVEGTGISLQNRGAMFSLNPEDANCIAPGKKTYHTIIPGFLMKEGKPVGPFGIMGGYMQPQAHVQVLMNYIDFHMDPQQALDAPRWQWVKDQQITVESRFEDSFARSLQRKGHQVRVELAAGSFGRGQMIVRLDNGVLVGGTESRADSNIACF